MKRKILIAVAWPYANGEPHVGHVAGVNIPADIFARYHRMNGADVVMVSGSDMHGTPTTLRAADERKTPLEVATHYHLIWKRCLEEIDISYDLYTHTHTKNHAEVTQKVFLRLQEGGFISKGVQNLPYSTSENRFLPDRLVEGTCPKCAYQSARGDQCDQCGTTLDPVDLIDIRSKRDGSKPVFKQSEHFFLDLDKFEKPLKKWLSEKKGWRNAVIKQTRGILDTGLHKRAITRDLEWGVKVPVDGYENKRIYVWFEAVLGYLSATIEWAKNKGDENLWESFWTDENAESYYFQGKDNIPFHAIILPAILMGHGELNLPTEVVASEFLNFGGKISKSKGNAVWLQGYLKRFDQDALRYYLTTIMPETADADFSWQDYLAKVNNELVATLGNFVHRTFTLAWRNFDGKMPDIDELGDVDQESLDLCKKEFKKVGEAIENKHFKEGLKAVLSIAAIGNRYIDKKAPWKEVKTSVKGAGVTIFTALNMVEMVKVAIYPFLPRSAVKIHLMLGHLDRIESQGFTPKSIEPGQRLNKPEILFNKLDKDAIKELM